VWGDNDHENEALQVMIRRQADINYNHGYVGL
jgi:hypothetical protein